jgi:hypothetical protein
VIKKRTKEMGGQITKEVFASIRSLKEKFRQVCVPGEAKRKERIVSGE